jgi:Pyruvate/2-oxoacid:ferredoxin oxidoreductase delta subunit
MSTRLYYFSGTGNSLWAARALAEQLDDTTATPMVLAMAEGETSPVEDRVGLVFPVYMYRMPHAVVRFVERLQTRAPVFAVVTMGGDSGDLFAVMKRAFDERRLKLTYAATVKMQSNYIPFGGAPDDAKLEEGFAAAAARVAEIAAEIARGEERLDLSHSVVRAKVHPGLLYKLGYKFAAQTDKSYRVDEGCDGCGICDLVCPVDNITMVDGKPTWNQKCEQCMACLQWCPQEVIQVKDKTRGMRRYHHPEVKTKDIVAQKRRKKASKA